MPKKYHLALILLIAAITLLVYYDSFNNLFVYDDYPFLVENTAVRKLDLKSVVANFTDWNAVSASRELSRDVWRPFMTTSFAIDYRFWKLDPRPYHIENTALHIINAILVYIAALLVVNNPLAAFITAIVFAIHPVQTEAVTWVSGRSNVLFLLFFLLSFIFHVRNRQRGQNSLNYSLSIIFFTCALLSKEMAITVPLVLILYDIHFLPKKDLRHCLNYHLSFFLVASAYIAARLSVLGMIAQKNEWWGGSIFSSMMLTLKALAGYIKLLFFPVGMKVEYFVGTPAHAGGRDILAAFLIPLTVAVLYTVFRRKKEISFYILWFFVTLIPVYNIVPLKAVMAERFLYLPLIGFAAVFGILFSRLNKTFLSLILMSLVVLYGLISVSRNMEWRDEMSFYMQEALRSPSSPKAHYNLGYIAAKQAEKNVRNDIELSRLYYALAIDEFKKTISLKPDSNIAYMALANAYNATGQREEAIKNFRKAIVLKEGSDVYNNLGVAYYHKREYDDAFMAFRKALRLQPDHANAWTNLGNIYFLRRQYTKAKKAWQCAVKYGGDLSLTEDIKGLEKHGY